MVRTVGNTPQPEEPHYSGINTNDPAEPTGPQGAKPSHETPAAHAAENPNGAASDVIAALTGDPIGASATKATSKGASQSPVTREISDTVITKGATPGVIDQSKSTLSGPERRIAEKLQQEGNDVAAVPRSNSGRMPDAMVNGKPTEFKSMDPGATSATIKNQVSSSIKRGGQARDMILDARGSDLSEEEARKGLNRIVPRGKLDRVRVIGDGYDLTAKFHSAS